MDTCRLNRTNTTGFGTVVSVDSLLKKFEYKQTLWEYALYLRAMLWCTCTSSIILCLVNCYFFFCILFYGTSFLILNETLLYKLHGAVKFIWIKNRVFCKIQNLKLGIFTMQIPMQFSDNLLYSRSTLYYSALSLC